jgi:hypothetical protein
MHMSRRPEVAVGVGDPARRNNGRALPGEKRLPADDPFVFAFENLKRFVLAMMDVRRTSARSRLLRSG